MDKNRYCVVMCGGVGSRFWPYSRNAMPKQFIDFFGTGRSLLQMTIDRSALSFYDSQTGQWVAEPGQFEALAATSASMGSSNPLSAKS